VITTSMTGLGWVKKSPYQVKVIYVEPNMSMFRRLWSYPIILLRLMILTMMYDVVFCNWFTLLASALSKISSKPIFVRLHRYEVHAPGHIKTANHTNIKAIITVSDFYKTLTEEIVGDDVPVCVISNSTDTEQFSFSSKIHTPLKICTLSYLVPRKRIFDLIVSNPDLEIHVGGVGKEKRILEDVIGRFNLKAKLYGFVNTPDFFYDHDIFVMNSSDEGQSEALLQAMSCGLIPLSFAWHGVEEIIPKENIYYSNSELREKILKLREMSKEQIMDIKKSMRSIVVTNFSLERQAQRFISLFRSEKCQGEQSDGIKSPRWDRI